MKKLIFYFIIICIISYGFDNHNQQKFETKMNSLVLKIKNNEKISDNLLLSCIPKTQTEAIFLFNIDYSKDSTMKGLYSKINNLWVNRCIFGNTKILKNYLEFSYFVDGYFAEDYFINIGKMLNSIRIKKFYRILNKCERSKTERIFLYIKENNIDSLRGLN